MTHNIKLNGSDIEKKREELLSYFIETFENYEKTFDIFSDDSVFNQRPEKLRHKLIFYFGHTATFYINKLILAGYITKRINPAFESIFAIGVDEMRWDDLQNIEFPEINKVREYRDEVKKLISNYIKNLDFTLPISWDSPAWIILMGIEHENIHIETSSVLYRQLDIKFIKPDNHFNICDDFTTNIKDVPKNKLIDIKGKILKLGKPHNSNDFYGWDNEYGEKLIEVSDFRASKYLVSNQEFLEFVQDGGYDNDNFWNQEAKLWKDNNNIKHPTFWIKQNDKFLYRTLTSIIALPLNWPVDVNYHEADAFCKYLSIKTKKKIALPSEAQYQLIREISNIPFDSVQIDANINFKYSSSTPIDKYKHGDFFDVVGNVWQWSSSTMEPFDGFKVHPIYDDFTVPTFDNKHNLIKGGSWASIGNETLESARYAFRKHFYQHAGFRYVETTFQDENDEDYYETDKIISQYCEFHYGESYLGVDNFPKKIAQIAKKYAPKDTKRVLDIGCSVGRTSLELKRDFPFVQGIDFSTRFIKVAIEFIKNKELKYKKTIEGDITEDKTITLKDLNLDTVDMDGLEFWQGDACNLKEHFNSYDLIVAINLLDRLYDSEKFLKDITSKINKDGIFIIASPFTWDEQYVPKDKWLGGKVENGKNIYSQDQLNQLLENDFIMVEDPFEVEFVIQEHCRKYQHTFSLLSIWKKR